MPPCQQYVSRELSHFVGANLSEEEDQYSLLSRILISGWLTHPPHKPCSGSLVVYGNLSVSENEMYNPGVVCFCDIPVSELDIHVGKYSRFGLSFRKSFLVRRGANPVFYVAKNSAVRIPDSIQEREKYEQETVRASTTVVSGRFEYDSRPRPLYFDDMLREYYSLFSMYRGSSLTQGLPFEVSQKLSRLRSFLDIQIFSYLKFFDDSLPDDAPDNFYMEREWRIVGNLKFELSDVYRVILPESYAKRFREDVPEYYGQVTFVD